eukprot:Polyplicarium_translucidae@DN436_c0_g1_i1.p1
MHPILTALAAAMVGKIAGTTFTSCHGIDPLEVDESVASEGQDLTVHARPMGTVFGRIRLLFQRALGRGDSFAVNNGSPKAFPPTNKARSTRFTYFRAKPLMGAHFTANEPMGARSAANEPMGARSAANEPMGA